MGLFVGGAEFASRGGNAVAWTFSTLGLWGILSIMLGSTKRLEKKQEDMYGKQEKYEKWKQNVRWPLIPLWNEN